MTRQVHVVPHTHWDREWYEPFQEFRLRLVETLDELLEQLESDPSYRRFTLDGQMAVVDDYLEVRPEAEQRLRRLAASGRLQMGPWYVLMDEFLVSAETLVRNLQMGIERAADFGGAMPIGYLPDMFGHVAQMPQLLRQAGFEHAVVWRGVPSSIDRTAFWWTAPDGSTVRTEYLVCGYGNGASIPDDAKALVRRIAAHEEEIRGFLLDGILFMNGTDHQPPQPWLGRVVSEANQIQDDYELRICSLPEVLSQSPTVGLPRWAGELRSGARAHLLMGVASNRVDVKQAAACAERALERRAEPLSAIFLPPGRWPGSLFEVAWRQLVLNSAHDSVCACSLDDVVHSVLDRYAQARHLSEGLSRRALDCLARSLKSAGPTAVNSSARPRGGVVEVVLGGCDVPEGCQPLRRYGGSGERRGEAALTVAELRSVLGMLREQKIGPDTYVNSISVTGEPGQLSVVIRADAKPETNVEVEEMKRELYTRLGPDDEARVQVRFLQPPRTKVLARVEGVPGFGWKRWEPAPLAHPVRAEAGLPGRTGPVLSNGLVSVSISEHDGTFAVDGLEGLNRLVDGGDHGDTYNYSPPRSDTVVSSPERVETEVVEGGPVRARVRVVRTYRLPERVDPSSRSRVGQLEVPIASVVELRANERLVRVETSLDNRCRDHRLRAVFPLPERAAASEAECAFALVRRGLQAEGGAQELGLPTFPSRRFVRAGGLTLLHEGLLEYELVDIEGTGASAGAGAVALTLLRSTGMMSQMEMSLRPVPAAPIIPLEGPQLQGRHTFRYAVVVGDIDPYGAVEEAFLPLDMVDADGGGRRGPVGSELHLEGAEVSALSRVAGALELRVFNPRAESALVTLDGRSGWIVDLRGDPIRHFDGSFELGPWAIATARLDSGG